MIRVVSLTNTCHACPAQWEGRTDDGAWVYVRYRSGVLRVGVGATIRAAVECAPDDSLAMEIGDASDGFLTLSELRDATVGVIAWPASAAVGRSSYR